MGGLRRIRRVHFSKPILFLGICLLIYGAVQWVIYNNYEDPKASRIRPFPTTRLNDRKIAWNTYQYVQFVTSADSLCNSMMIWHSFEELENGWQHIKYRADRTMYIPSNWDRNATNDIARLLREAELEYHVHVLPLDTLNLDTPERGMWNGRYTMLLAFNLTEFSRVVIIDPASLVRQNLDELFLMPDVALAMPYIYFGASSGWQFSSQMMLVKPSAESFLRVSNAIRDAKADQYDVDLLTTIFYGRIMKLHYRPYGLVSGEFRRKYHEQYIGDRRLPNYWDPDKMLKEAKILFFSDGPIAKPWVMVDQQLMNLYMPKCRKTEWFGATACRERTMWFKFYSDYAQRRVDVCGVGFEVQADEGRGVAGPGRERTFHAGGQD